ncbi:MAG: hypothetical protein ACYDDV_02500 [Methanoregula sp.]
MNFDKTPTLAQWGILILVMLFAGFTAGLIQGEVSQLVSPWFSPPVHESNLSTAELSERILQQPSEIPGNYAIVEWKVRDASGVSPIARNLGWKKGFVVRYQEIGSNASYGSSIQQTISVYPLENVNRALPGFRYYQKLANENNDSILVDELPDPGIGDASTATKLTQKDYTSSACLIDFVKNDVYEQIMMYGPAPDYETAKKLAEIAAAKIK